MTLENKNINARELFEKIQIIEETEDEYGRMGRGIPLIYFNLKYEKNKFFQYENVEKAVLDFKEFLDNLDLSYMHERGLTNDMYDTIDVIQEEFEKEFGKFQK